MAYRPFFSGHHYSLFTCFLGLVTSDITMAMTSSLWNNVGENTVTSSMTTINTSRVTSQCVMECHQMGSCVSVVFDPESDTCYLQPTYRPARQGDDGPPLHVYITEKVAECKPSEAPDVANAHVTKWRVTSSSLDGDVSCDQDYMLSEDVTPQVRCPLNTGAWTTLMIATCKQFAWRNYTVQVAPAVYPPPRPAKVGLCVRVKGTPTKKHTFEINLGGRGDDVVLHLNPRLNHHGMVRTTVLHLKQGTTWVAGTRVLLEDPSPPFPFAVGVAFDMVVTAVSLYTFSVQVNSAHYVNFTGTLPVTDVINVFVQGDVSIESLIIGC